MRLRPTSRRAVVGILCLAATAGVLTGCGGGGSDDARDTPTPTVPAPDDPLFPKQWNLHQIGDPPGVDRHEGEGAVVAVLDTGVAYEDYGDYRRAPDLAGTRFVPGWDFVDDDDHPNDEPVPGKPTHGTHMTGTIAQTTNNHLGPAGIAPGAAIMPVRVLMPDGNGDGPTIAKGLRFAVDHGAHVANLSLGSRNDDPELADAVRYAIDRGVTVVAAAGEEGSPTATFPAAYPGVIAVGATRPDKTRAPYSNFGPRLDLVAPGGDRTVDYDGDGLEDGIVQQSVYAEKNSFCFCFIEGTSSAAAHVSGAAALVVASGKATTPSDVASALLSTAEDLGAPGRDDDHGAGLVQAAAAARSVRSGGSGGSG